jgi:hypothetical protein
MTAQLNRRSPERPITPETTRTLMQLPRSRRIVTIAGTVVLTLALTASLATWPWNQVDVPAAEAQEEAAATTDGIAETEPEALAEAVASGESVEVLNLRSETREVVVNPDGTSTATEYTLPVRTVVDGAWVDIDPTLSAATDGVIRPEVATVDLAFSSGGDEPLVTLVENDHTMTLDWPGDLPVPTLEGDTAIYAEVLPDVDLRVTALENGFTHNLVVKSAAAAANPELATIEWPVTVDGAAVQSTPEGGVEIVDEVTGDLWVVAGAPTMWDSTGVAEAFESDPTLAHADPAEAGLAAEVAEQVGQQAAVEATVDADSIDLAPDASLLTAADTVYPVYIDPVYRSEARSARTMVASAYPDEEYWGWSGDEGLGKCSAWSTSTEKCSLKRLYFRVSTSFYSGKTILSATFAATLYDNYSHTNTDHNADLDLTGGISSGTNWNNQPGGSEVATADTPAPSKDCGDGSAATEWNVQPEVANAASKGTSALTFRIRNANESSESYWMRFCDNAYLSVRYNRPPYQPAMSDLRSSVGSCQWTINQDSYTPELPVVYAVVKDPDGEQVKAEIRFTDKNGNLLYSWTSGWKASGSELKQDVKTLAGFPAVASGTEIRWEVRVSDGEVWGPWSSAGDGREPCRFVVDAAKPAPPAVTSTNLIDGEAPSPMAGKTGALTIDSASADVVSYTVKFNEAGVPDQTFTAAELSGPVTVPFQPMRLGRFTFDVLANDATGWSSSTSYGFLVTSTAAVASWPLSDAKGSTTAANATGGNHGTVGSGVVFEQDGPGAALAAKFDGSTGAYISTDKYGLAPTGQNVAIAAWAKVDNLAKSGVIASIDGGMGESGMIVGYRSTSATGGQWYLSMPDMAMGAFSTWEIQGGQVNTNTQSDWVQLVGVWSDVTGKMTLYVNGAAVATGDRQSAWWGDGTVQIGRAMSDGIWGGNFAGQIADVHVFNRSVTPDEALDLGFQAAMRTGYWQFTTTSGGASPATGGGLPATMVGNASIATWDDSQPLNGDGSLKLDGAGDYSWVDAPMVDTAKSFSLTARVKLDTAIPESSMTVLSIPGTIIDDPLTKAAAVEVAYTYECDGDTSTKEGCWQLRMTKTASDATTVTTRTLNSSMPPSDDPSGQSIAVTYNAITGQARLYVGGTDSGLVLTGLSTTAWSADGDLQIGRGYSAAGYRQYFSGLIDEVRTYGGVLTPAQVNQLDHAYVETPEL